MLVVEIGGGELTRRISGCTSMDPNYEDSEYGAYKVDHGLPFKFDTVDIFISRYSFRNVWDNESDLKFAFLQMEKCLKWGGVIIIKDYPEWWTPQGEYVEVSPTTIKETYERALKGVQNLTMESFAFDLESGDFQTWIVKEHGAEEIKRVDKVLSKYET
jgi:SAM-dependent methyltransferase